MFKKVINIIILISIIYSCPEGYVSSSNTSNEECIPEQFYYNSSTQQAAYFFSNVYLDGVLLESNDWVGAFNGDVCVGSRKWDINNCNGICDVPVLGQDSQLTQGYMLNGGFPTFKIFKSSSLSYINAYPSVDYPWSNFSTPIIDILHGCQESECSEESINVNIDLFEGWNWISLNIINNDMSLNSILSSINNNGQFIKNQEYYADYYENYGWFGTLSEINNTSMYKLKMYNNDDINISGLIVNVSNTNFNLLNGWNWIGYAPQNSVDINTALSNIPSGSAEFIKSQYYYSEFYENLGWFGTLESMDPLLGYIISLSEDTQFNYSEGDLARISSSVINFSSNKFGLNIHDYEHNATITSSVFLDNNRINDYDYTLLAFDGISCVGYTDGLYFPLDGSIVFPLMVYGNHEGNNLTFKLFDNKSNNYIELKEEILFFSDMKLGNAFNPIEFHNLENPNNYIVGSAYPNPFNPVVNFDLELKLDSYVDIVIYDLKGIEVEKVHSGYLTSKLYHFNWNASKYSSGIYLVKILIDKNLFRTNKVILLK